MEIDYVENEAPRDANPSIPNTHPSYCESLQYMIPCESS